MSEPTSAVPTGLKIRTSRPEPVLRFAAVALVAALFGSAGTLGVEYMQERFAPPLQNTVVDECSSPDGVGAAELRQKLEDGWLIVHTQTVSKYPCSIYTLSKRG